MKKSNKRILTIDISTDKKLKKIITKNLIRVEKEYDLKNKDEYIDLIFEMLQDFECFFFWKSISHNGLIIQVTAYEWKNFLKYLKNELGMMLFLYNTINRKKITMQEFHDMREL